MPRTQLAVQKQDELRSKTYTSIGSTTCTSDTDCGAGVCLNPAPGELGGCAAGTPLSTCVDQGDCLDGFCVTVGSTTRRCIAALWANPCNDDSHCIDARCAVEDGQYRGFCTTGKVAEPCGNSVDCVDGTACAYDNDDLRYECASGAIGHALRSGLALQSRTLSGRWGLFER